MANIIDVYLSSYVDPDCSITVRNHAGEIIEEVQKLEDLDTIRPKAEISTVTLSQPRFINHGRHNYIFTHMEVTQRGND